MTEQNEDFNPASQRHWLYGFNAGVLVLIGLIVMVFVLIIADRTRGAVSMDWSSNGVNSLSGSTKKLLKEIDDKKQDYQILSLFVGPSDEARKNGDPGHQTEKRQQVEDLLNLYGRASSHVQVEPKAGDVALDDIESRVRKKYANELKPYQDAVEQFNPISQKVSDFLKTEGDRIAASVQRSNGSEDDRSNAAALQNQLHEISSAIDKVKKQIRDAAEDVNPKWIDITNSIKDNVDRLYKFVSFWSDASKLKDSLKANGIDAPALVAYFTEAAPRYKAMADEIKAYQDKIGKLESPKIEEVLSGLGRNCIVIMGPDSAKVLTGFDLYDSKQGPDGQPQTTFKGEEAISSALLSMVRPEKVKVVFVTASQEHLTTDVYSDMADILRESNFDVEEWSPPGATPDNPTPAPATPPAEGKGVVWIVFPPSPPNQQMMMMGAGMPNPQAVIDAVQKHLKEGGQALFLAEAGSANQMGMMAGTDYPYDSLVKPFGIDVMPKYTVVQSMEAEDASGQRVTRLKPYLEIDRFEDSEITKPIQSYNTAFFPGNAVTVVDVEKTPPAGVEAKVLIKTPYSADFWGETNFAPDAKFDRDSDMAPPVPLAAIAVKDKGKPDEQRIMVIGCKMIGANPVIEALQPATVGDQTVLVSVFPGNSELMRNSILWLAGYENMIAVSAKANANVRIGDVSPAALAWIRVGVLVAAPALALILGGLIWFARHQQ